jgi:hypothetical protein
MTVQEFLYASFLVFSPYMVTSSFKLMGRSEKPVVVFMALGLFCVSAVGALLFVTSIGRLLSSQNGLYPF